MAPKVRDRNINALIMAGSGSIVAVLTFWLNSSDTNAREIEKQIDGKLDKTEFTSTYNGITNNYITFDIPQYHADYLWFKIEPESACTEGEIILRIKE